MITRITLALALMFAALATVPASAQDHERTCGYQNFQYDSSGATVGPYCD